MSDRNIIDLYLASIDDEYTAGAITELTKYKLKLQIAAEYLVKHDDEHACFEVLYSIPEIFYGLELQGILESDSLYALQMLEFTSHLEKRGITTEISSRPTQATARA